MNKKLLEELKEILEKQKIATENELKTFAKKDEKLAGDWDTRFPKIEGGNNNLEEAASEVEEYSTLLPIEYNLELKLQNVNLALEKIKKNKYGICEKCKKEIPLERLKISPESKYCLECQNK